MIDTTSGVYFSANDAVYEWTLAFLNSYRRFNPKLRLILIPFNEDCERLLRLQRDYDFEIWSHPTFSRLEAIGQAFELGTTPTGPYWFRRYATFWGPLDKFMYLDARLIVLANLAPFIKLLDTTGFDLLHYDCAVDQVYIPGPFRQQLLQQGRGRGFMSGLWISRKGVFTLEEFEELARDALKIRDQLNPRNTDQAFINYCCDMKPVHYGHLAEVAGGIVQNAWARRPGKVYQEQDKYFLWDYGGLDHRKQVILLHWAGQRRNSVMSQKRLFDQYNQQRKSSFIRFMRGVEDFAEGIVQVPFESLRRNQFLNLYYHRSWPKSR